MGALDAAVGAYRRTTPDAGTVAKLIAAVRTDVPLLAVGTNGEVPAIHSAVRAISALRSPRLEVQVLVSHIEASRISAASGAHLEGLLGGEQLCIHRIEGVNLVSIDGSSVYHALGLADDSLEGGLVASGVSLGIERLGARSDVGNQRLIDLVGAIEVADGGVHGAYSGQNLVLVSQRHAVGLQLVAVGIDHGEQLLIDLSELVDGVLQDGMSPRIAGRMSQGVDSHSRVKALLKGVLLNSQLVVRIHVVNLLLRLTNYTELRVTQAVTTATTIGHAGEDEACGHLSAVGQLLLGNINDGVVALPVVAIQSVVLAKRGVGTEPDGRIVDDVRVVSTVRSCLVGSSIGLSLNREHVPTGLEAGVVERTSSNAQAYLQVVAGLDTGRSHVAVLSRTLQALVVGREAPTATFEGPLVAGRHVVPVDVGPGVPVGQIGANSVTGLLVHESLEGRINLCLDKAHDLCAVLCSRKHRLQCFEHIMQFVSSVSEVGLCQDFLNAGNVTLGNSGIKDLDGLVNLETSEHDVGSHVVGIEHQVDVGRGFNGHHHRSPLGQEAGRSSHSSGIRGVVAHDGEEVHVVGVASSDRAAQSAGRLHPVRNGVEARSERPLVAQPSGGVSRSLQAGHGVLAVRAYAQSHAPSASIEFVTKEVSPSDGAITDIERTIRYKVIPCNLVLCRW